MLIEVRCTIFICNFLEAFKDVTMLQRKESLLFFMHKVLRFLNRKQRRNSQLENKPVFLAEGI